jgi:hypothetical protein
MFYINPRGTLEEVHLFFAFLYCSFFVSGCKDKMPKPGSKDILTLKRLPGSKIMVDRKEQNWFNFG